MMRSEAFVQLQFLQDPQGGFASFVTSRNGCEVDCNGFVTAMVLRRLRHVPDVSPWTDIRRQALDWLWSCRSTRVPGAFAFWPNWARPSWASNVPPDVDDTAVMLTELLRHHRLDRTTVLRHVCRVIVPCRVTVDETSMLPCWIAPGSFFTWIDGDRTSSLARRYATNVVDCCVNANVVALMACLNATHLPGFDAAVQTIVNGLEWAADDVRRLHSLTPFYPSVGSLADAVEHAVECGATALQPALDRLANLAPALKDAGLGACRSAYGRTVWHAPAIDLARGIANSSMP